MQSAREAWPCEHCFYIGWGAKWRSCYLNRDARAAVMHYTHYYSSSSFPVAPVLFSLTRQTGVRVVRFVIDKLESY